MGGEPVGHSGSGLSSNLCFCLLHRSQDQLKAGGSRVGVKKPVLCCTLEVRG